MQTEDGTVHRVSIGSDFSRFPFGRKPEHGPFSGEAFRTTHLVPFLRDGQVIEVVLDGARGLSPSFLEEAFGGLVRDGFAESFLLNHIKVVSVSDPSYVAEVWGYIKDAMKHKKSQ